MLIIGCD
jgi:transposase